MHSDSMALDLEQLLYQYCKEQGGYFVGNPLNDERYPQCSLILDMDKVPLVMGSIITSSSQYGVTCCASAQMQAKLQAPYSLDLRPMDLLRRGLELVMKEDIEVNDKALDKKYLIRSDNPEFTKLILPGSSLARLLLQTKEFKIKVCPMGDERELHNIQVLCTRHINDSLTGKLMDMETIALQAELCREAYNTITQYPML